MTDKGSSFHRFQFYVLLTLSFLVSLFPRKIMVKVGRCLGGLVYLLWRKRRKIALTNLDLAFGHRKSEDEKVRIAQEAFKNIAVTMMEFGWGSRNMNEKIFFEIAEVKGLEILESALSKGKGVLLLPSHYGNWEIMANACGYLGFNANFVAKRLKNPYIDKFVNAYRCETGNKVIYMNGASKEMVEALKEGGIVATLLDQKVPLHRGGIPVTFFGRKAATTPLIAQLHLLTCAPMVPIRCYPLRDGRCQIVLGPEIEFEPSGDDEQDIRNLTQRCSDFIESYIRVNPQFWIWGHKRWKMDKGHR